MEKKSQFLIIVFAILVTASIVVIFYKYILLEDIVYEVNEEIFQESLLEE